MTQLKIFIAILFLSLSSQAATTRYVSDKGAGKATGKSAEDAADFLNSSFWADIQGLLRKEPVTVKFLAGNYERAYTEKPLLLKDMGNEKNALILEGDADKTIFVATEGSGQKSVMIELKDVTNMIIRNFSFTGNGKLGYGLRIISSPGKTTKNILVENCSWTDMRGIIYGATGCHQPGTQDVTYRNCVFKRIGIDSHSHHMYHAHSAVRINVLDSYFEDCTGDYVRFRDNCDFITVKGSTFVRNQTFPVYPFISIPLFNNVNPGDEHFSSNFAFSGNSFTNAKYAIAFHIYGYTSKGFKYLLTAEEGKILTDGSLAEKKKLLKDNFGIDADKVSIGNNKYSNVTTHVGMGTFSKYGSKSLGFDGWGNISGLFK